MRDDLELGLCEVCEEREIEHTCVDCGRETCDDCGGYASNHEWLCEDCLDDAVNKENQPK